MAGFGLTGANRIVPFRSSARGCVTRFISFHDHPGVAGPLRPADNPVNSAKFLSRSEPAPRPLNVLVVDDCAFRQRRALVIASGLRMARATADVPERRSTGKPTQLPRPLWGRCLQPRAA